MEIGVVSVRSWAKRPAWAAARQSAGQFALPGRALGRPVAAARGLADWTAHARPRVGLCRRCWTATPLPVAWATGRAPRLGHACAYGPRIRLGCWASLVPSAPFLFEVNSKLAYKVNLLNS